MSFNTAIVKGSNAVTGGNVKLGRWDRYLTMREGAIRLNEPHRARLSNDLGAIAGLLFDIGSGRCVVPPRSDDDQALAAWQVDLDQVRQASTAAQKQRAAERESDTTHTEIQGWLLGLGHGLGFRRLDRGKDRNRPYNDAPLAEGVSRNCRSGFTPAPRRRA